MVKTKFDKDLPKSLTEKGIKDCVVPGKLSYFVAAYPEGHCPVCIKFEELKKERDDLAKKFVDMKSYAEHLEIKFGVKNE